MAAPQLSTVGFSDGDTQLSSCTTDTLSSSKGQQFARRSSLGKAPMPSRSAPLNTIGLNNGGKIRLRERRSNGGGIKSSQNPNRASYPSALLPTVTENRSFDNRGQYNSQKQEVSHTLNKQDSETNLTIGIVGGNGAVCGLNNITVSRNSSTERLSGTDGKSKYEFVRMCMLIGAKFLEINHLRNSRTNQRIVNIDISCPYYILTSTVHIVECLSVCQ